MDNHQLDIAEKLFHDNYLLYCLPDQMYVNNYIYN